MFAPCEETSELKWRLAVSGSLCKVCPKRLYVEETDPTCNVKFKLSRVIVTSSKITEHFDTKRTPDFLTCGCWYAEFCEVTTSEEFVVWYESPIKECTSLFFLA